MNLPDSPRGARRGFPLLAAIAGAALLLAFAWVPAGLAQDDLQADIDALIRASKARAAIVAKVKDAVVHISV